jgi:hypothetical protein
MLINRIYYRNTLWASVVAALLLGVQLSTASLPSGPRPVPAEPLRLDPNATQTLRELNRLGLLRNAPPGAIDKFLTYQRRTGRTLPQIMRERFWATSLGLAPVQFRATWYAANPFDLLPKDLQVAIRETEVPFKSRKDLEKWCDASNAPEHWRSSLKFALIETTASNLWRAARGLRPFTKNGQFLEPIVIERGGGVFDVKEGHIATDPAVIPTGSKVLMLVRVGGKDRLLRVKATDIGSAVRGEHVDLPIQIRPKGSAPLTAPIRFPKEYIRNSSVIIFTPGTAEAKNQAKAKIKPKAKSK